MLLCAERTEHWQTRDTGTTNELEKRCGKDPSYECSTCEIALSTHLCFKKYQTLKILNFVK